MHRTRSWARLLRTRSIPSWAMIVFITIVAAIACVPTWRNPVHTTGDQPGTIYVCVELPEDQRAAAREAVKQWDTSLRNWKRFNYVDGRHSYCSISVHETINPKTDEPTALAWTTRIGGTTIYMLQGSYEHDTRGILLHELGHALGAQHVEGTLMNKNWYSHLFECPDVTTVAQIAAWNKVDLDTLSWCQYN